MIGGQVSNATPTYLFTNSTNTQTNTLRNGNTSWNGTIATTDRIGVNNAGTSDYLNGQLTYLALFKSALSDTNRNIAESVLIPYVYPPAPMTLATTTFSGLGYGNGAYTASASTTTSTYYPYLAFDRITTSVVNNMWHSGTGLYNTTTGVYTGTVTTNGIAGEWIQLALPAAINVYAYSITNRYWNVNQIDNIVQSPWQFTLMGSNNSGTTWTNIDVNRNQTWTVTFGGETFTYRVGSNTAYNLLRLVISKSGAAYSPGYAFSDRIIITEIRFFGN